MCHKIILITSNKIFEASSSLFIHVLAMCTMPLCYRMKCVAMERGVVSGTACALVAQGKKSYSNLACHTPQSKGKRGLVTLCTVSRSRGMQKMSQKTAKMHGRLYAHAPQIRYCQAINLESDWSCLVFGQSTSVSAARNFFFIR